MPQNDASEANWSGSALFLIQYRNSYQRSGLSYLIGWQLEMGVASKVIENDKGYSAWIFRVYTLIYKHYWKKNAKPD